MQDIVDKGNAAADKLVVEAELNRVRSFGGTGTMRMHNLVVFGTKANELHTKAVQTRQDAVDKANMIGKSFFKSAKYLMDQKKKVGRRLCLYRMNQF